MDKLHVDASSFFDARLGANTDKRRADQPTIPMTTHFSNNTCEPNLAGGGGPPAGCPDQCLQGFLSPYAILAESANHIKAGVNFARQHNLRIVIRNTGHDFMGRSSGWGALVINTHRLNSIEFDDKKLSDGHTGGTVKIGAGVMFQDVYPKAWAKNLDVLGGECPVRIGAPWFRDNWWNLG